MRWLWRGSGGRRPLQGHGRGCRRGSEERVLIFLQRDVYILGSIEIRDAADRAISFCLALVFLYTPSL